MTADVLSAKLTKSEQVTVWCLAQGYLNFRTKTWKFNSRLYIYLFIICICFSIISPFLPPFPHFFHFCNLYFFIHLCFHMQKRGVSLKFVIGVNVLPFGLLISQCINRLYISCPTLVASVQSVIKWWRAAIPHLKWHCADHSQNMKTPFLPWNKRTLQDATCFCVGDQRRVFVKL